MFYINLMSREEPCERIEKPLAKHLDRSKYDSSTISALPLHTYGYEIHRTWRNGLL